MRTILYNTIKDCLEGGQREGRYMVDGAIGILPVDVIELAVTVQQRPAYDQTTQKLTEGYVIDLETKEYRYEYQVVSLSEAEIALAEWGYEQYPMCLEIEEDVIFSPEGGQFYAYYKLNGNPMKIVAGKVYVWINAIQDRHQGVLQQLQQAGLVYVKNRPTVLS